MNKEYYKNLDGLRSIAAIGIVLMHIAANSDYVIKGFIYNNIINSFANFVFLFMTISSFGLCCGYLDRVKNSTFDIFKFYKSRFLKILPFFSIVVCLDVIVNFSTDSLIEGFFDVTLLFGFLPSVRNISVIGVGWFLGLIFVFYICFPFFCFLIRNKKYIWIIFTISIILSYFSNTYFKVERENILYCSCFFVLGGLIYYYKNEISKVNIYIKMLILIASICFYYIIGENIFTWLFVCSSLIIYAIGTKSYILNNKVVNLISRYSMEIYLSHMIVFRVVEKTGLNKITSNQWGQYIITNIIVLIGSLIFAIVTNKLLYIIYTSCKNKINKYKLSKI